MATVLIVEDDFDVHGPVRSLIRNAGYETLSAYSLTEAKAIISSDADFDLVFTDIDLGDHREGGIEVGIATVSARSKTPVLYTSGRELTPRLRSLLRGQSAFLVKPYNGNDVLSQISRLLGAETT